MQTTIWQKASLQRTTLDQVLKMYYSKTLFILPTVEIIALKKALDKECYYNTLIHLRNVTIESNTIVALSRGLSARIHRVICLKQVSSSFMKTWHITIEE